MGRFISYNTVKDTDWQIYQTDEGKYNNEQVSHALLMDIRGQLQRLNMLLHCQNFQDIPAKLERIARQTKRKKKAVALRNTRKRK